MVPPTSSVTPSASDDPFQGRDPQALATPDEALEELHQVSYLLIMVL